MIGVRERTQMDAQKSGQTNGQLLSVEVASRKKKISEELISKEKNLVYNNNKKREATKIINVHISMLLMICAFHFNCIFPC